MLNDFTNTVTVLNTNLQQNLPITLKIIGVLFAVYFVNLLLGRVLLFLGIRPRHILGLPGIIFAPFLHTNFEHLIFNTFPLFILMNLVIAVTNLQDFIVISCMIILISGLLIWLFGRRAIHVGASAVILGYFGFLLTSAYTKPSFLIIISAVFCFYYFFGLIFSLFPTEQKTSFEGHIFGLIAGIITAYSYQLINVSALLNL